jgi:hypothetical protein
MNQDVHAWAIGGSIADLVALARSNTGKNYGDVLSETYIIETDSGLDGIRHELAKRGLSTHLEISPSGFTFWAPEGTHYKTKSRPAQ